MSDFFFKIIIIWVECHVKNLIKKSSGEQSRPGLVKAVVLPQIIEFMNVLVLLLQMYYMYYHDHKNILLL